jgi:rRNA-processing protein FCF1
VKKLREQDEKFRNDFNVVMHAKEKGMILITKDKEPGQACNDNKIPCIWLSDERIFDEMVIPMLYEMQKSG